MRDQLPEFSEGLSIWTVYDSPPEFPDQFVAVLWVSEQPTDNVLVSGDLGRLRAELEERGLTRMYRSRGDDPKIVEVWL